MPETELTKKMKKVIRSYKPIMKSNMRTIRWAEEVDVGTGYVDSIRFEDYIKNIDEIFSCTELNKKLKSSDINNSPCGNKNSCTGCFFKSCDIEARELGIMCTCFEMKITKADFKSKNGHNFVGNRNYYVMPKDLYESVKELVPKDIGVIIYCGHGALRIKRECKYKEVDSESLNRYMFNALKKWCDLDYCTYEKYIG